MEEDGGTLRECRKGGGIVINTCHKVFTEAIDLYALCSAANNWQDIITVKAF
jgi:hypothetical protein